MLKNSEKVKYSTFLDGFLCGLDVTFKVQAVYKYVSASILYQALSCLLCCICAMTAATTPSVRTPRDGTVGGSAPFTLTVDYELPQTPVFSPVLVSFFCWPKSVLPPLYSYHITSCLWMAAHSPALRSTFQAIGRRGRKGLTFLF